MFCSPILYIYLFIYIFIYIYLYYVYIRIYIYTSTTSANDQKYFLLRNETGIIKVKWQKSLVRVRWFWIVRDIRHLHIQNIMCKKINNMITWVQIRDYIAHSCQNALFLIFSRVIQWWLTWLKSSLILGI